MQFGKRELKFTGTQGAVNIMGLAFTLILITVAVNSLGLIEFPISVVIEGILVLAATVIIGIETFYEKRKKFQWDFPTIMATFTIIGNGLLVVVLAFGIPSGVYPLVDALTANRFVLYMAAAIFTFGELFRVR